MADTPEWYRQYHDVKHGRNWRSWPLIRHVRGLGLRRLRPFGAGRQEHLSVIRYYWADFLEQHRADVCGRGDTCDEGCVSGQRLSVGDADACAVLQDGGLACWGGEGRDVPERVSGLIGVEQVASGSEHICVRLADRTVR